MVFSSRVLGVVNESKMSADSHSNHHPYVVYASCDRGSPSFGKYPPHVNELYAPICASSENDKTTYIVACTANESSEPEQIYIIYVLISYKYI